MKFRVIQTTRRKAKGPLLSELRNRMFHVTSPAGFIGICAEGAILANTDDRFATKWPNSYFKNQGCLSVVDLVNNTKPIVTKRKLFNDYAVFEMHRPVVVFLFFSTSVYSRVITWKKWKKDKAFDQQVVPWLESGIPDSVLISEIEEAWFVSLKDHFATQDFYSERKQP